VTLRRFVADMEVHQLGSLATITFASRTEPAALLLSMDASMKRRFVGMLEASVFSSTMLKAPPARSLSPGLEIVIGKGSHEKSRMPHSLS